MDIYRNLHKACWSLKIRGLPIEHHDAIVAEGVEFVVQPAGNARVRREKKKHVHAFVRTHHTFANLLGCPAIKQTGWEEITYNPYKYTTFVEAETERPVKGARWAFLTYTGKCFAHGLEYFEEAA